MTATTEPTAPAEQVKTRRRTVAEALGATVLGLGIAAAGGYVWLDQTSDVRNTGVAECTSVRAEGGSAEDLRAVCSTIGDMTAAWDRNDADAYGAAFTENATATKPEAER